MSGVCAFIEEKLSVLCPNRRVFLFIILSILVVSCSGTHKFLGTKQPGLKNNSCPIESEFCTFSASKNDWKIIGTYYLDKLADGNYHLRGSVKVDVIESSPVFQSVSRLNLTFFFFQGDMVIHEEVVRLSGEANEYIAFSQMFDPEKELESSLFAWYNFQVTELPAIGAKQKKSTASDELLPKKTYIRIESVDQIYENGQQKFTVNRGDILEVIRVKTCISGSGVCWQVRNTKTGETGFRRADVLKQRHMVYEAKVESTSKLNLDERPIIGTELSLKSFTGSYRSEITGKIKQYLKNINPEVKLVQSGNTISGTYGDSEGKIWGKVEGNVVKFDFQSSINAGYGTGKWTFKPESGKVQGTWFNTALGSGDWNLAGYENYQKDGTTEESAYANISGTYISDITSSYSDVFPKTKKYRKIKVSFEQRGKNINVVSSSPRTIFEEITLEGDFVKFALGPNVPCNCSYAVGKWKIINNGELLEGEWQRGGGAYGKWNLTRIE